MKADMEVVTQFHLPLSDAEYRRAYKEHWRSGNLDLFHVLYGKSSIATPTDAEKRLKERKYRNRYNAEQYKSNPAKYMIRASKQRAKRAGLEFNITESDINIPETCPILGIKLEQGSGTARDCSPSLDRVDSTKGYVKGNVQVISFRANSLKRNASIEELEAILRYMKEHIDE